MIVAVSVDMEGASQLRGVREIWGCLPEYWETGRPRLEADVRAVCEGLLAGGASELVVLDNHGGNTVNVSSGALPSEARLETWRDFDLRSHAVAATFQVAYHARGGVEGFLSHTYVPGLRFKLDRGADHEVVDQMTAALLLGGFDSAEHAAEADQERVAQLRLTFDAWAEESQPEWWDERADPLPPGIAQALAAR